MSSQCRDCAHLIDSYAPSNAADTVRYQQWQHNDKTEKVDILGTMHDVLEELKRKLRNFLIHTYVKHRQAVYMNTLISNCDGESVVLQVDFSKNYYHSLSKRDAVSSLEPWSGNPIHSTCLDKAKKKKKLCPCFR